MPHREEAEFGQVRPGLAMCKSCFSFQYNKSWHHDAPTYPPEAQNEKLLVRITLCPACRMIKERMYEGKLVIENVPTRFSEELERLIRSYSERAFNEDCQHRLIDLKKINNYFVVTTTENQLATKLARKIKNAFNGVKFKAFYSKAPSDTSLVRATFLYAA